MSYEDEVARADYEAAKALDNLKVLGVVMLAMLGGFLFLRFFGVI